MNLNRKETRVLIKLLKSKETLIYRNDCKWLVKSPELAEKDELVLDSGQGMFFKATCIFILLLIYHAQPQFHHDFTKLALQTRFAPAASTESDL